MDEQRFDFRPSLIAPVIYLATYGIAGWLLCITLPTLPSRAVAGVLLATLALLDLNRCGFVGPARIQCLLLRKQRWLLWQQNQWQAADVALYYRGPLCVIISWRKPHGRRVYYTVIWRDRLQASQWRLLLVYFSLRPITLCNAPVS